MRRLLPLLLLTACAASPEAAPPSATPTPTATNGVLAPAHGSPSTVVEKVTTGGQPCGVVAAAGAVWVTDAESAKLLKISGGKVVATTKVDESPCELTSGYGSLWVATQSRHLDRVDPRTGRVTARIAVGDTSYEPLAAFGYVWVTNRGSGSVSKVDPRTNRVVATIATPFVNAGGIAALGNYLWVGNDASADTNVVRLDPRTGRIEKFEAGDRPGFVAVAGGSVWAANQNDGTVTRLDSTGRSLGTVPAGQRPVNLAAVGGEVWVPDDQGNLLTRIDARTGEVVERLLAGTGPAVVAPDGTDVWVTNFGDGTVWRVRPGAR